MRHIPDDERRARLAVRHALVPAFRLTSAEEVVRAMTVLHATLPATVYLSYWARARLPEFAAVDRAFYEERSLVKQLAMRRTLFVFPRDLLASAWASASARVASTQRIRMAKEIVKAGIASNGERWLEQAREQVISTLAEYPDGLSAVELRKLLPITRVKVNVSANAPWSASQLLTYFSARGDIVRATNLGVWSIARPRWTLMKNWLGDVPEWCSAAEGYRELVYRWLRTFGPGTEEDIVWWLGSTKAAVRTALAELAAVEVSLDHGDYGWLLPDQIEQAPDPGPWVALLPALDPTVMGWRTRRFYLDRHSDHLFDNSGNAGTTVWVDGRVVGYWVQDQSGVVQMQLLEQVSTRAQRDLASEAKRLTEWLGGLQLATVFQFRGRDI